MLMCWDLLDGRPREWDRNAPMAEIKYLTLRSPHSRNLFTVIQRWVQSGILIKDKILSSYK
jgi:hypothetical protein